MHLNKTIAIIGVIHYFHRSVTVNSSRLPKKNVGLTTNLQLDIW